MKDISKLQTLFTLNGVLHETIGRIDDNTVVIIRPVRESDYMKCECGRPLPDQSLHYVHSAPILQNSIDRVYTIVPNSMVKEHEK